jgi:hypothetical protein
MGGSCIYEYLRNLDLDTSLRPVGSSRPGRFNTGTHRTRGCVGPRIGSGCCGEGKILTNIGIRTRTPWQSKPIDSSYIECGIPATPVIHISNRSRDFDEFTRPQFPEHEKATFGLPPVCLHAHLDRAWTVESMNIPSLQMKPQTQSYYND